MTIPPEAFGKVPLYYSRSHTTTERNRTGSWRFVRPKYELKTAPCTAACPLGQDIGRIEMLTARGQFRQALEVLLSENPFPAVCGRVCPHACESACNRGWLDEAVAVHSLERFLGDMAPVSQTAGLPENKVSSSREVAVAGAGPAGLAAAYFLSRLGYACDLFETRSQPGGLLRWAIPAYRLPHDVLEKEIARIKNLGVRIHCGQPFTEGFFKSIQKRYAAVVFACGHGRSHLLNIAGQEIARDGLAFLNQMRQGHKIVLNGRHAVIGGGNAAIDVARSLLRLGAQPVLVYRRRKQDMPAFGHELEAALAEGVTLLEQAVPVRIEDRSGTKILTLLKTQKSGEDLEGRVRFVPVENQSQTLEVCGVFTAIGAQAADSWYLPADSGGESLRLSHCTLQAGEIPVILGGDLTNRTKSVADAVASGKQAAMALDTLFKKGWGAVSGELERCRVGDGPALSMEIYLQTSRTSRSSHVVSFEQINSDYFKTVPRTTAPGLSPAESVRTFAEIEPTFTAEAAVSEARRCFNCGLCNDCDNCRLFCPELAVALNGSQRLINLDYCKGCGVCSVECPRNAISLEEQ